MRTITDPSFYSRQSNDELLVADAQRLGARTGSAFEIIGKGSWGAWENHRLVFVLVGIVVVGAMLIGSHVR